MIPLVAIALATLATAAVAMALRNLIHSALLLIASWAGIAAFYLWAGAEFVAFAQVLVYIGAISMVVLFAVLLTRRAHTDSADEGSGTVRRVILALASGGAVLGVLVGTVLGFEARAPSGVARSISVKQLGADLAGPHAAALLIVGVLLTVALLGAIVIAAPASPKEDES